MSKNNTEGIETVNEDALTGPYSIIDQAKERVNSFLENHQKNIAEKIYAKILRAKKMQDLYAKVEKNLRKELEEIENKRPIDFIDALNPKEF